MFAAERPSLAPYVGPFDGFPAVPASTSKTCLVRFDSEEDRGLIRGINSPTNKYSVIASAVGRPVEIRAYAERIELRQDGRNVGQHRRAFDCGKTVYDPWRYVPVWPASRARCATARPSRTGCCRPRSRGVRRKLRTVRDGDRQMVEILGAVLSDGLPAVESACAEALREGVHSADPRAFARTCGAHALGSSTSWRGDATPNRRRRS